MRIVSLLPAATDMVVALGHAAQLVGVTHECDRDGLRANVPVLTQSALPRNASSAEIDRCVASRMAEGLPLTLLDDALLSSLQPDLILTQSLCDVCALTPNQLHRARQSLAESVTWIEFAPRTWADILLDIARLGQSLGCEAHASRVVEQLQSRISQMQQLTQPRPTRSCVVIEWLEPFYGVGHWTPELLSVIGLQERIGRAGEHSLPFSWAELQRADPDILLIACCGRSELESRGEFERLSTMFPWSELQAIREGRVWILDGHRTFSRPGPGLVDSIESLHARLDHAHR
jgi:iron complex transport system substrate-binding protein